MIDPKEVDANQVFAHKVRSAFVIRDPDQLFIDRLEKKLVERFKDLDQLPESQNSISRRLHWLDNGKFLLSPLAWGMIAITFVLILIWGIKNLVPGVQPGVSTQPTASPSMVPTVDPTQAEALESEITLPVSVEIPVPWPKVAIAADNAAQITQLARWGKENIRAVAWAPDGNSFAVVSSNKIAFYDRLNFNVINTIYNGSTVYHIAYSPDGTRLASDSNGTSVKIWDIANGSELQTLSEFENFVTYLAFLPDGESLAVATYQNPMKLWDVNSGQELRTFDSAPADTFVFSPDGTLLASTGYDRIISLWDVDSGEMLRNFPDQEDHITALSFSPDGEQLASASGDLTIKLWEVSTGNEIKTLACQAVCHRVDFLPDGNTLMSHAYGEPITLWDIASGRVIRTIGEAIVGDIYHGAGNIILSPDGNMVLSYSLGPSGAIRLFDISSGEELRRLGWLSIGYVYSIAFSPNGRLVAVGFETGSIKLLDASTGQLVRSLSGHTKEVDTVKAVLSLAFSPDGALLASGAMDNTVRLWDVASGEELFIQDGVSEYGWWGGIPSVDFSPDGKLLAFGGPSGQVKVWDVIQNIELRTLGGRVGLYSVDPVAGVAFSPDAKLLAAGYGSGLVTVWDALSGQQLHTLNVSESWPQVIFSLEYSPDGKILAVASFESLGMANHEPDEVKVSFWDTTTWENIRTLLLPGDSVCFGSKMIFSPAGDVLVIGSDTMDSTFLLEVASGKELIALSIISSGLAFSPDGKILLSGGFDGAIHVWGMAPPGTTQEEPTKVVPGEGIIIIQEPTLAATP